MNWIFVACALTCAIVAPAICQAATLDSEKVLQVQEPEAEIIMNKVSEHISKSIEVREKKGQLQDENDPLAIMLSSVTKLRAELQERLDNLEAQKDTKDSKAKPVPLASLAMNTAILFVDPETLKSISDQMIEETSFKDYSALAEEQDPELKRERTEEVRRKTVEMMREKFGQEMHQLIKVLFANLAGKTILKSIDLGDPFSIIVYALQSKLVETVSNILTGLMVKHSDNIINTIRGFINKRHSGVASNSPDGHELDVDMAPRRADHDRGDWMLHHTFD